MAQRLTASDRLPWLTEVPRTPTPAERPHRRAPWGWAAGALLLLGVGTGAYWLGTRQGAGEVRAPGRTEIVLREAAPVDDAPNIPSVSDITAGDELTAEPQPEPAEQPSSPPERVDRPASPEKARKKESAPKAVAPNSAPPAALPTLPPVPLQPIVRGRIVQLGAFSTRVEADVAWRAVTKRFPYLASKPRLISPIEVRSTDGQPTRMYRLQMATASQAQSVVICQQLESKRQSCVVVY